MKWKDGFSLAVVVGVVFGMVFGVSELLNVNLQSKIKMKINNFVLAVPRDALWLPPLLVGTDFWSKEGYKIPDDNKLQDFSSISLRGCWIPGAGFRLMRIMEIECNENNNAYDVSIGLYATRSGHAEGMIKRGLDAELKKSSVRTWGGVGDYNYGEWSSGYDGLKLMRLIDSYGMPVLDNELWNIFLYIHDSDSYGYYYVSCPYFAVRLGSERGDCDNRSIWPETDIYVTINYSGRVVGRSDEIRGAVLVFLNGMIVN